ncbi:hypothetical protein XFF6166_990012 [Xanthomonas citri pv. fuscans]|nr:hypothetical protein XFF6166_990012 [Xanthomonas citri pv. fuscans]SOO00619.1 hypothetical protein XFF6960_340084 [Xanthomonas citri pv. fuscans]SOO02777.1 hypothetical protein XFF7767_1160015 [Xanthomonas citri pv. fuscans]SOO12085.1 hypothetical protein XFF6970_990194 [Xanthomonas citri pv. fuscans]SOO13094.1 hypothetical protein XFF7766_1190015 [Xanthomonas citri pv. fuscans]
MLPDRCFYERRQLASFVVWELVVRIVASAEPGLATPSAGKDAHPDAGRGRAGAARIRA